MDELGLSNSLYTGTQSPGYHDITPSYINQTRKACYCIMFTLEVIVLSYLICHLKCKIRFIYAQLTMMMISSIMMLIVHFVPGLNYAIKNSGFYLIQISRLFDLLYSWNYVFYILRVSLLMPTYLNFKQLHLYKHQRSIYLRLYWTNGVAYFLNFLDIIITTFIDSEDTIWLSFLPLIIQGLILTFATLQIYKEI